MAGKTRRKTDWSQKTGFRWSKRLGPDGIFTQLTPQMNTLVARHLREIMPAVYAKLVARLRSGHAAKDGKVGPIPPYSKAYARLLRRAGLSDRADLTLRGGLLDHLAARVRQMGESEVQSGLYPYGSDDGGGMRWLRRLIRQREGTPEGMRAVAGYSYTRKNGTQVTVAPRVSGAAQEKPGEPVTYQSIANQMAGRMGYGKWAGKGKSDLGERAPARFLTLTFEERTDIEKAIAGETLRMIEDRVKASLV